MATRHDALFKAVFASPDDAAGLIRPLLPAHAAAAIDWSTLRQLTKRFGSLPATIVDRVCTGTSADLDRWADAVLTAPTLDAVFAA